MNDLKISEAFTIEDIHKIRVYNYEKRKNMTFEEEQADIAKGANAMLEQVEEIRKQKQLVSS